MMRADPIQSSTNRTPTIPGHNDGGAKRSERPLVSLVVPAYNEAAILESNLSQLCHYMASLEADYRWELLIINDGSTDATGNLAEAFASPRDNVRVLHHLNNGGLGQAFKLAFHHCRGDYVVTLDMDLSYAPAHIHQLLSKIRDTQAQIVVASPYMAGGQVSHVPWLRRTMSRWANRFLAATARGNLSTLTGMVRAYDGPFLRTLHLTATGMEINPEIIYKAMVLRARIEEVPAHLDWHPQPQDRGPRRSSMRVARHTMATLLAGFLFKPFMFFILPGLALLLIALYANSWMLIHVATEYQNIPQYPGFFSRLSAAVATAYTSAPHTFIVGGMTLMLAVQLISLGILALQSKGYFEELFHLGTTVYRCTKEQAKEHM